LDGGIKLQLPYERKQAALSDSELIEAGCAVLQREAEALRRAAESVGSEMVRAARLIADCGGRIVVSGMGKSGHVGRKTAATFASLGVPAFFLHAAEGSHGDLGMVCRADIGFFISNSGETGEVISLIPYFKRIGAPIIAVTGSAESTLAKEADVVLSCRVEREADPLGLAPTSSTTLQMAIGDAVAGMTTMLLGLEKEDFAMFHPGGSLGKRLLLRVSDLMAAGSAMPITRDDALVRDALFEITSKGYGTTIIVDEAGDLKGIFTDGDLRRLMEREGAGVLDKNVKLGMTVNPRVISGDSLAAEALHMMQKNEISALIVMDGSRPVGLLHIHDLLKAGVA
jgi:arabinose-5-phosphate isomerase